MSAPHPISPDDDGVHALPPLPAVPAAEVAAQLDRRETAPDSTPPQAPPAAPRPRRPAAKRPPRPRARKAPVPPPPDLPPDVAAARFEAAAETVPEPPVTSEQESGAQTIDDARAPSELVVGADAESAADAEVEAEPVAESMRDAEVEPESAVEVEPEQVAEDEPTVAGDPVVESEPEPEPVAEAEAEPVEATTDVAAEPDTDPAEEAVSVADDEDEDAAASSLAAMLEVDEPASAPAEDLDADERVDAVRLRGVTKTFGTTVAVDAMDLRIPAGTFYGIVGPNGAGKTTTLSMIAGLLRPDGGEIRIAGVDLASSPRQAKQKMGILPDRLRTFDRLTGRQLLHYYGVLRGLRPAVVDSRSAELARAFDLTDALSRPVSDYSAGMTKKIMLAGAMIHSPRVLVLDEPFESVDPVSSAVVLDILSAYVAHGGTVVLSSHGMELVERVCSGLAVIVGGRVLAEGTVDEVRGGLTLEERFIELSGGISDAEGLEWLHTFSD